MSENIFHIIGNDKNLTSFGNIVFSSALVLVNVLKVVIPLAATDFLRKSRMEEM